MNNSSNVFETPLEGLEDDEYDCAYCGDYATARAVAPKIPGFLSVLGSIVILRELFANHPDLLLKRGMTIQRILASMSLSDIFFSMPYFFTTWLAPREIEELWQSAGSFGTCTLQGWSIQFGVSTSPLFSMALTLCAMLIVRYNWNPTRMWKLELWIYGLVWTYGLVASVPLIFFDMYNPTMTTCWVAKYPRGCKDSREFGEDADCERGDGAAYLGGFFAFFPTWPALFLSFVFMVMLLVSVRQRELKMGNYASSFVASRRSRASVGTGRSATFVDERRNAALSADCTEEDVAAAAATASAVDMERRIDRRRSNAVVRQVVLYTLFFMLTFSLDTYAILKNLWGDHLNPIVNVVAYSLFPMQGLFNLIIFIVPRKKMLTWEGRAARYLITGGPLYACARFIRRPLCCSGSNEIGNGESASAPSDGMSRTAVEEAAPHEEPII